MAEYPSVAGGSNIPTASSFFRMFNGDHKTLDARADDSNRKVEHALVRWLMSKIGNSYYSRAMVQAARDRGSSMLTCEDFNETFPSFPFYLGGHSLKRLEVPWQPVRNKIRLKEKLTPLDYSVHMDDHSTEPARFNRFDHVPFVIAYQQLYNRCTRAKGTRSVALIYPRLGFPPTHGGMCIHDDNSEQFWESGLCQVFKSDNGQRLYVQPFAPIVAAIFKGGWQPD